MQIFALGILVVQIADRDGVPELAPLYLGLMGLARAVPGLALTLIAGAVADRVDRRKILFLALSVMAANAAMLAFVTYAGYATLWIVLVASAVHATAFAFENPARQSMVPRIVPLPFLPSAIGLQSAAFHGAAFIGPLLAGALYRPIGIPGLFAANALSFVGILAAVRLIPALPPVGPSTRSLLSSVVEGARYVRSRPVLQWILVISGTNFVVAGPAAALFPAVAGEALWNGMSWLSLLLGALGVGSFSGALVVMNIGRVRSPGTLFVAAAIASGATLIAFALSVEPVLALLFAYFTGLGGTLMAGMGNNMLQATTDDAYRGRVMSLWAITFIGVMPIGQLGLGVLGSLLGIHAALAAGGAIALGASLYAAIRVPFIRSWRAPARKPAVAPTSTVPVAEPTFR